LTVFLATFIRGPDPIAVLFLVFTDGEFRVVHALRARVIPWLEIVMVHVIMFVQEFSEERRSQYLIVPTQLIDLLSCKMD